MVFIHEWGHFYVARLCGVKVDVFAIGFGKTICSIFDNKGTEWKINILPLGGYVKMYGDAGPASNPDKTIVDSMTDDQKKLSFFHKSLLQKTLIVFAGPFMNYILAVVVMMIILVSYGDKTLSSKVAGLEAESPAAQAGILIGDVIQSVNGQKVPDMIEVKNIINKNRENKPMSFTVLRGDAEIEIWVTPKKIQIPGSNVIHYRIGVIPTEELIYYSLIDSFLMATERIILLNNMMIEGIIKLISGRGSMEELGGPIKIAQISGEAAKNGMQSFLTLLVILSINLGLMNLLPIPGLDGGHLMYYAISAISGRAIPKKIEEIGIKFGIILLMSLLVFVTYNDILGLFK
jgi:regulator of sigma E protease